MGCDRQRPIAHLQQRTGETVEIVGAARKRRQQVARREVEQRRAPAVEREVVGIHAGPEYPLRLPLAHEVHREVHQRSQIVAHDGNRLRVAIDRGARHHARAVGLLRHHPEHRPAQAVQLHERVAMRNQALAEKPFDPREDPLMGRDEEGFLVPEVIKETRPLNPDAIGDLLHLRPHEPVAGEHRLRGLDDAIARVIGRGRTAGTGHVPTYMSVGGWARAVPAGVGGPAGPGHPPP